MSQRGRASGNLARRGQLNATPRWRIEVSAERHQPTIVRTGSFSSVVACLFTSGHEAIPDI